MRHRLAIASLFAMCLGAQGCIKPLDCVELLQCAPGENGPTDASFQQPIDASDEAGAPSMTSSLWEPNVSSHPLDGGDRSLAEDARSPSVRGSSTAEHASLATDAGASSAGPIDDGTPPSNLADGGTCGDGKWTPLAEVCDEPSEHCRECKVVPQVAAGAYHSCSLPSSGAPMCWGNGDNGRLGVGGTEGRTSAMPVVGLAGPALQLALGGSHSCALLVDGRVQCWGSGNSGRLGNGATVDSSIPVNVTLEHNIIAIAAGSAHSCALMAGGSVKCWGSGLQGRLGDGAKEAIQAIPVSVLGLDEGAKAIATGADHSCAVLLNSSVKCWGSGSRGRLGNGSTAEQLTAVSVSGLTGADAIAIGSEHSCALLTGGQVKCWGAGTNGQLGNGTLEDQSTPVSVTGLDKPVEAIALGAFHSCALLDGGKVQCWGAGKFGKLGNGSEEDCPTPSYVLGIGTRSTAITTGGHHTCSLIEGGAECWGLGADGQLGNGRSENQPTPVSVVGLSITP